MGAPQLALPRRGFLQSASAAVAAGFAPGSLLLGRNCRSKNPFAILPEDMHGHMHIVGASGKGKSNYLEVLLRQHILQADGVRRGVCVIDPHGTLADSLLEWIADNRVARYSTVRFIDVSDPSHAFGFNPLVQPSFDPATLAELMAKATMQAWGADRLTDTPRLATVLTETYYALAVNQPATLLEAVDLLRAEDPHGIRRRFIEKLPSEVSRSFWEDLEGMPAARRHELLESTWSRLRPFLRSPVVRAVMGQTENVIDLAAAMDAGEVIIISLRPSEHLSSEAARLLGTLLVTEFYTGCFRRKNTGLPFYLFIDEAQLFLTPDIARILDQSRKFGLYLCLSHQHMGHLREAGEAIMRSVLTNCRVRAVFGGLDPDDARLLARTVFRGQWEYALPKPFYQPMVVGVRRTTMANSSQSFSTSRSVGDTEGESGSDAESQSVARSHSSADNFSETETDGWNESTTSGVSGSAGKTYRTDGLFPELASTNEASGDNSSSNSGRSGSRSVTTARAITTGETITDGTTTTVGWNRARTTTHGTSQQRGQGVSEAFEPIYEWRRTQLVSLDEQIQQRADALARLPVGQMWLQIDTKRPRRIAVAYLGEKYVLPALTERVRGTLLASTPYVSTAQAAQDAHRAHRLRLLASARPSVAEEEPDDFTNIAAKLRAKRQTDESA